MTDKESEAADSLTDAAAESAYVVLRIMRDKSLLPEACLSVAEIALNKGDLAHCTAPGWFQIPTYHDVVESGNVAQTILGVKTFAQPIAGHT